jgi:tetratricopeptide (TPR) repeat protein
VSRLQNVWAPWSALYLEVTDYQSPARWRLELLAPTGELIGEHEVRLDESCWQYEAFADLPGYLRWHSVPDRRIEDEARIVAATGEWIGERVLGPLADDLAAAAPATVRVVVPEEAKQLMFRPLQLAYANGRPLAVQGVTLIMQPPLSTFRDAGRGNESVGDGLRVLGLFSMPAGERPLNLRRERQALAELFTGIAAIGRAVEVRVLQFGVTRGKLQEVLVEGGGWDIVHVSGHGSPGELLLEAEDGSPDPMPGRELAGLLSLTQERLKLVTVSACWSAALTAEGHRRLLGLPISVGPEEDQEEAPDGAVAGTLASDVASLGCAVLAMRYPVTDVFAIALARKLYGLLAEKGQHLPHALGIALREVVAVPPTSACPALSVATPALFGTHAVTLKLAAPPRRQLGYHDAGTHKLGEFPPQPDLFLGRTRVMTRASAALAPRSGTPGVLLHGMPGVGKTACALELAYTHEHAFDTLVWFKAPGDGQDISTALAKFVLTLEALLPGLQMRQVLDDPARLAACLPHLTELCARRRALVIVDSIESLLTEGGQWRDTRWGQIITAITAHSGLGRVVLTSCRRPTNLDMRVQTEVVDPLSLDEALLLARDLPLLSKLFNGSMPGIEPNAGRNLAREVLTTAHGHPKLLELADGQAADPGELVELVKAKAHAWQSTGWLPEGFFSTSQSQTSSGDYRHLLDTWAQTATNGLVPGQRDLFHYLCCLEEQDRTPPIAEGNWTDRLWKRLNRAGRPPVLNAAIAAAALQALIEVRPGADGKADSYRIHPAVAAAGRTQAGSNFRDVVDTELAAYWQATARDRLKEENEQRTGGLVVRAARGGAPYLLRLGQWRMAGELIAKALERDHSRAAAAAVLPALQQIVAAVSGTRDEPVMTMHLARALRAIDPVVAELHTRAAKASALAYHDYRAAGAAVADLIDYCIARGQLEEALALAMQKVDYIQRAKLGPWSQLSGEGQRLQVLVAMGQHERVLAEVHHLIARMDRLPTTSKQPESHMPWNVREVVLDAGRSAAFELGRWQEAMDMITAVVASMRTRGALATEIARIQFNIYSPLLKLGRFDDCLRLLLECRDVFEQAHDVEMLGVVLGALASLETIRGHDDAAIALSIDSLRYNYLSGNLESIKASHHNLGLNLARHARDPDPALAHHVAAALIAAVMNLDSEETSVLAAAYDLRFGAKADLLPTDIGELCRQVAEASDVDLGRLLAQLDPGGSSAQVALDRIITQIRALAAAPAPPSAANLALWDPVIAALLASQAGDAQATVALEETLASREDSTDWAALVGMLRRLRAGKTGPDLLAGLDPEVHIPVANRILDVLDGRVAIPVHLWRMMPLAPLIFHLVAAARGGGDSARSARRMLDALAQDPGREALASRLDLILAGEHDPDVAFELSDPAEQAVVTTVLHHIREQIGWGV